MNGFLPFIAPVANALVASSSCLRLSKGMRI